MYFTVPFSMITDIILGNFTDESNNDSNSKIVSIITAAHTLELEIDDAEVPIRSLFIEKNCALSMTQTRNRSSSKLSSDTTRQSSSAFSRPSNIFRSSTSNETAGKNNQNAMELAACPRISSRHPFIVALRTAMHLYGHMQGINYLIQSIQSASLFDASSQKQNTKKRPPVMRAFEKAQVC